MSRGENLIVQILKKEKIKFIREKTFSDLKCGYYRYDFYLPDLNICIEYDGIQHFIYTKIFHKKRQDFLKAQERDRRKNSYALANGILLYRVPFWKFNELKTFEDITSKEFLVKDKWHCDKLKMPKNVGI